MGLYLLLDENTSKPKVLVKLFTCITSDTISLQILQKVNLGKCQYVYLKYIQLPVYLIKLRVTQK